jgi:hypothetical protein
MKAGRIIFLSSVFVIIISLVVYYFYASNLVSIPDNVPPLLVQIDESDEYNALLKRKGNFYFSFEDSLQYKSEKLVSSETHSGRFSFLVKGKNSYSPIFKIPISDVGLKPVNRAGVSAWLNLQTTDEIPDASMVIAVKNKGKQVLWRGNQVSGNNINPGKWFKISAEIDLDESLITDESVFEVYLWNNSKTTFLIDDIFCSFGAAFEKMVQETSDAVPPPMYLETKLLSQTASLKSAQVFSREAGNLRPQKLFKGHFTNNGEPDQLLTMDTSQPVFSLADMNEGVMNFRKLQLPENVGSLGQYQLFTGNFTGGIQDEILLMGKDANWLFAVSSDEGALKLLWNSGSFYPESNSLRSAFQLVSGNFFNSNHDQLLAASIEGEYRIYAFFDDCWNQTADGTLNVTSGEKKSFRYFAGERELYLLISPADSAHSVLYAFNFTESDQDFSLQYALREKDLKNGLFYYLRTEYSFFPCHIDQDAREEILIFQHDWRNSVFLLDVNPMDQAQLSRLLFSTPQDEKNPLYYENLCIMPGYFSSSDQQSVFTAFYNSVDEKIVTNADFMPGMAEFSFKVNNEND